MRLIRLSPSDVDLEPLDDAYKGRKFPESSLRHVVTDESTAILKPDGSLLCMLVKKCLSASAVKAAHPVLRRIDQVPKNRSVTTMGAARESRFMMRKDGTRSETVSVSEIEFPEIRGMHSSIIGYYDRHVRWPYCRATAFNLHEPEKFEALLPYVREVDAVFRKHAPERYEAQRGFVSTINPAWVVPGTTFTTITVNRNYPCAVHKDAGDYRPGLGVMTVLRAGEYTGGITYWPGYRVGARMDTGDVCLADVHEWHGVTDMVGTPGRFERVSCVFYCREKMCHCGTPEAELVRAKARKLGDPLYDPTITDEEGISA